MQAWRDVEFPGERSTLRGRLYSHADARPVVVMGHGFSATAVGMVADRYAEVLHAAGLAVLLYDHEGFGRSGGEPRCVVSRWLQARGFQHAMTFAASQAGVLPDRIALWGDSFSAGVALSVAALDERVAALVLQVPACGSTVGDGDPGGTAFAALRDWYATADVLGAATLSTPSPVVSPDQLGLPSLLTPITAYRWFIEYGGRPGTTWQNRATRASVPTPVPVTSDVFSPRLRCPSLWLVAEDDEMPGSATSVTLRCAELAGGRPEVVMLDGGHFGLLYDASDPFATASRAQAEFLTRVLTS